MERVKEILEQEYQFKLAQMENKISQKESELTSTFEEQVMANKQMFDNHSIKVKDLAQADKIKYHGDITKEIYEDVYKTLDQKFRTESKLKLTEISNKLKLSCEEKVLQL